MADLKEAKRPNHGLMAPSNMLFDLSGIIKSESNFSLKPNPLQALQAPNGELNEKERGSSSPILNPQLGQAFC